MVLDLIKDRQSIRTYKHQPPSDEQIEAVLDAANLAPSWLNVQPWHFIVVKNKATKSLLAKLAPGQAHIEKAPVVVVCCGNLDAWEHDKMKKVLQSCLGLNMEQTNQIITNPVINPRLLDEKTVLLRTVEQMTYAIAYMTIEAQNQGLGACVVGAMGNEITKGMPAPYQVVREELGLPQNMFVLSLLLLGIPEDGISPKKVRKNKSEIVSYESYSSR